MQYRLPNIIGDAGEHLVAARVIKLFKFPCRLLGIDIGIDAEIEIIDENYKSTGEFIKCQIKTTTSDKFSVYIDEEHMTYWNKMSMPVVIFLVHLETEKIYWHCVNDIGKYQKSASGYVISFDESDILLAEHKERFKEIAHIKLTRQLQKVYDDAYAVVVKDNTEFLDSEQPDYDLGDLEKFVLNANKIMYSFKAADKLIYKNKFLERVKEEYAPKLRVINAYLHRISEEKRESEIGGDRFDQLASDNFNNWD